MSFLVINFLDLDSICGGVLWLFSIVNKRLFDEDFDVESNYIVDGEVLCVIEFFDELDNVYVFVNCIILIYDMVEIFVFFENCVIFL